MSKSGHLDWCIRSFATNNPLVTVKIIDFETRKFWYNTSCFLQCVDTFKLIISPHDLSDAFANDIYAICEENIATHFLSVAAPVEEVHNK